MRRIIFSSLIVFVAFGISYLSTGCGSGGTFSGTTNPTNTGTGSSTGTVEQGTVTCGGSYYYYYKPANYATGHAFVVYCHGQGGNPEGHVSQFGPAADEKGFLYIGVKSPSTSWVPSSDASLITSCINDAKTKFGTPSKQFIFGYSAGGVMSAYYGCSADCSHLNGINLMCAPNTVQSYTYPPTPSSKKPVWGCSNSGDPNFSSMQSNVTYFQGKGHTGTFVDESGRVNGHTFDSQSVKDSYDWLMSH